MKKIVLILALVFAFMQTNAQQKYDTVIYYSPELLGCQMSFDSINTIWGAPGIVWGASSFSGWYEIKASNCYVEKYDSLGNPIPLTYLEGAVMSYNTYLPEGVAQPYHLDSSAFICGVAARAHGILPLGSYGTYRFRLLDSNFSEKISVPITSADTAMYSPKMWDCPMKNYYFADAVKIKDFYLAADITTTKITYGTTMRFNHTCSIFDTTPCLDTILGCQSSYSPLLKKNGQWIRFADDTVYEMFQKTFIELLPIILVPKVDSTSSIKELDLSNTCNVYPNPAKDKLNIISQFKVKELDIYNISGVKLKTIPMNSYEKTIDISSLRAGTYIVKLHTPRGIATKTILVE
ncbi:MAG: Protein of unknown function precursor [Bacteroidetes bacterium]|nr:Protein of unknown function precursor [Bacteroidota bacterium]